MLIEGNKGGRDPVVPENNLQSSGFGPLRHGIMDHGCVRSTREKCCDTMTHPHLRRFLRKISAKRDPNRVDKQGLVW